MGDAAPTPPPRRALRWWHGLVLFAAAMAMQILIGLTYGIVTWYSLPPGSGREEHMALLLGAPSVGIQVLLTSALLSTLALLPARLVTGAAGAALRLARPSRASAAVLAAAGVLPAGMIIDQAAYLLHDFRPGLFHTRTLDMFSDVFAGSGPLAFAVVTLAITLGPALGEELFFRGLLLRSFLRDMPAWAAVSGSAALFGVLHMDPLQGAAAGLMGLYLGYAVLATGSVWPAVAAHGLNNLACSLAARFDPEGLGRTYEHGHHPAVLAAAAILLVLAIVGIERARRRPVQSS